MEAMPDKSIAPATWGELLATFVDSRKQATSNGHLYIYMTADMQYKLLPKNEASESGLTKLSLEKIMQISISKLGQPGVMDHIENLGEMLAAKKIKQMKQQVQEGATSNKESAANAKVINVKKKALLPLQDIESKFATGVEPTTGPRGHNLISPERLQELAKCLDSSPAVLRSGDGRDGVFYLEHPDLPKVVLKFCSDVHKHILADRLIAKFFETPQYESLSSDMKEAERAVELVAKEGRKNLDEQLSEVRKRAEKLNKNLDSTISILSQRIDGLNWLVDQGLLVAKFMNATSFKEMMADDRLELLTDTNFLYQLGEMMLVDAFLHNTDRISEYQCNKANFMIAGSDTKKQLICIDHDFNITPGSLSMIKKNLTNLLAPGGNGLELRVNLLINEGTPDKPSEIPCNRSEVMQSLQKGVHQAAIKLVDLLRTDSEVFNIPDKEGCISSDPIVIKEIIGHIEDLLLSAETIK